MLQHATPYAPLLLRVGIAIVYLYFGISQLRSPEMFVGWLPKEAALIPLTARTLVTLNGGFELFAGILLLLGLYTRVWALLLGLHLAAITWSVGWTEIGVRDLGLTIATLTIVLTGGGKLSLDSYFSRESGEASRAAEGPKEQDQKDNPQEYLLEH